MSLFSKIRRSKTVGDRYVNHTPYTSSAHRHNRDDRQRYDSGEPIPSVSFESIPYLPSDKPLGASSEVSLPSEYTHLDNDTNRYPKLSSSASGVSNGVHRRRVNTDDGKGPDGRIFESQVAPMLAAGTLSIMWDVRESPAHMKQYRSSKRVDDLMAPAVSTHAQYLCLVSHDFPWTIAISTNDGRPLTALNIIEALYESLNKEVRRSEWALAADVQRYVMQKANKGRRRSEIAMRVRRVDWLGSKCMFRGLEKDESLTRKRLMPGDYPGEMWAVRFGSMH